MADTLTAAEREWFEATARERQVWQCKRCRRKAVRREWPSYRGRLCCGTCLKAAYPDTLEPVDAPTPAASEERM